MGGVESIPQGLLGQEGGHCPHLVNRWPDVLPISLEFGGVLFQGGFSADSVSSSSPAGGGHEIHAWGSLMKVVNMRTCRWSK